MKRVLYVLRQPPGASADETTDMMLVSGVFEQQTAVLFIDDGVYQLIGLDRRQSSLKALPTYGITALYACRESLDARGLDENAISPAIPIQGVEPRRIAELIAGHDVVITD